MTRSKDETFPPGARSGGALLVDCLLAHGVPLWTCVPGESFLPVLDALYDHRADPGMRLITARHEAAAANMAEAAGKLTGRAAVCLVTRGPGATHASIALHTAYQDGTPLVLVVGQVARGHLGRQAFQEMDFGVVFGSSAKSVVTVMDADRIPEHVAAAMHTAHSGRPGPVVLVLPEDVLTDTSSATVRVAPPVSVPEIATADRAVFEAELARASRPVLIVGGPGWSSTVAQQVTEFAERNDVPIVAAFRWQDAIDNRSAAYAGWLGLGCSTRLRELVAESDLVVGFGPRLDDPTTNGYQLTQDASRLLLVSQDAHELVRDRIPEVAVHAGLTSVADALASLDLGASATRREWVRTLREQHEKFTIPPADAPDTSAGVDLATVVRHIRAVVPDDAVVTNCAGNYAVWLQRFFEFRTPGTQLAPRNGAMGYGLPAGLAAAALNPDRTVVTFAGDGCALMSGNELATAVQHDLRVVLIVANNSMFGTIRMHQERAYPGRQIATALRNPDFAAYARSFGALGLTVTANEDFPAAFAEALAFEGPALIELRTDPLQITPDRRLDAS